jgi:HlyD family secretion protein
VQTVTATGKIQPMIQVNISADVSAKITRLEVEEGEWIEQGTLLVELDRERYLAAVESAQANLRAAQANANLARENMVKAEKDYDRTRELFDRNLESQAVLDTVYAAAEVEKARYQSVLDQGEQAKAALRQAKDDLAKTTIYAPMAGTVSMLNKEVGEIALGSQFQEDVILEISNLEGMEALVDIDENDIVAVSIGDEAEIEIDALPDVKLKGTVTEIANSAKSSGAGTTDEKTEFEVKVAIIDPIPELRPGMTASAEIVTEVCDDCLSVPIQSVAVRTLDQLGAEAGEPEEGAEPRFAPDSEGFIEIVWVVADGRAEARQVKTGIQSATHIEINQGLEDDEDVVIGNYRAISRDLKDGSTVAISGQEKG